MSLTYAQKSSFCETIEELRGLHEGDLKAAGVAAATRLYLPFGRSPRQRRLCPKGVCRWLVYRLPGGTVTYF